eukprot:6465682-Amphidinium_carterae.1
MLIKQWCAKNGLSDILTKFLEANGRTIKRQYVTADIANSITMRVKSGQDRQLHSRLTISHSHGWRQ